MSPTLFIIIFFKKSTLVINGVYSRFDSYILLFLLFNFFIVILSPKIRKIYNVELISVSI